MKNCLGEKGYMGKIREDNNHTHTTQNTVLTLSLTKINFSVSADFLKG